MFKYLLVAVLAPAMVLASVDIIPCSPDVNRPAVLEVAGCSGSVCNLVQGQAINAVARGIPSNGPVPATTEPYINLLIGGLTQNFPVPDHMTNACNFISPPCASVTNTFDYSINIDQLQASGTGIPIQIEIALRNAGTVLACARFAATVN
ncbi:uncharacterized protein LOC129760536 [Uranotaenia lowii]|uniref:uncharacterized protein LOC129758710 n=1 Tax=Uranotaenia lowii TaxID=190385 RepID=UPI00247A56DB|nr:uncharacterized protein LOC129758710 [Uranotaenia lowii]XP_055614195.1 uncharacterized protein LOC129760536 [Uranotaenia lowii]